MEKIEKENLTNIIQVSASHSQIQGSMHSELVALCDDGSVWLKSGDSIRNSKE